MRVARAVLICVFAFAGLVNAQTSFSIQSIQANTDGSITIAWPAIPTWTYHVMSADALDGSWQDFPDGQLTAGTNDWALCYTDTNAAAVSQRFYKVWRDSAQLVMTLVLDRSGSMGLPPPNGNGGGQYLPGVVSTFISFFDDNQDRVAMVSFATTATVDVPMARPFKNAISTAVNNLSYAGGTFAQGGLTNALVQNNSVVLPPGQNALKVAVFFTDGFANIIQDTLNCPPQTTWDFGGFDSGDSVGFFNPTTGNLACSLFSGGSPPCCPGTSQFRSAIDGTMKSFLRVNVTADAQYRAIQTANDMRAANTFVYAIGLGIGVDTNFLQQVANDPSSPTFNPNQPVGQAVIANDPTALDAVFQQIASVIQAYR